MIFRSALISRRAGLGEAAFATHWRVVHGGLARRLPGLHGYLQNHIARRFHETSPFPGHAIDGISQLWFDDIAAMEVAEASPEYAAVKRDIPEFQGAITILVLDSAPAFGDEKASEGRPKLIWLSTCRDAVPVDTLRARWQDRRGTLDAASVPGACRMVQNFVVDAAHPVAAGVTQGDLAPATMTEVWFEDWPALAAWAASDDSRRLLAFDPAIEPMGVYGITQIRIR